MIIKYGDNQPIQTVYSDIPEEIKQNISEEIETLKEKMEENTDTIKRDNTNV